MGRLGQKKLLTIAPASAAESTKTSYAGQRVEREHDSSWRFVPSPKYGR
jgi:hypothetical protein